MRRFVILALWLAASSAAAQTRASDTKPFAAADPTTSRPIEYQSVFDREPAADSAAVSWQRANEEMARLRGHAGHLREAAPVSRDNVPAAPPAAAANHHRH